MKVNRKKIVRGRPFGDDNDFGSSAKDDGSERLKSKFSMRKRPAAPAVSTVKTRKELRKTLRKAKKAQKHQYILVKCGRADLVQKAADEIAGKKKKKRKKKKKKKGNKSEEQKGDDEGAVDTGEMVKEEEIVKVVKVEVKGSGKKGKKGERERLDPALELRKEEEQLRQEMEEVRRKRMIEENEEEERNIRQLSKKLKLNKRANIPASFRTDGLDYLLEVCEQTSGSKSKKKNEESDDDEDYDENDLEGDSDGVGEEDLDDGMDVDDEGEEESDEDELDAEIFGSGEDDEGLDLGENDDENASEEDSGDAGEDQVKAKGKAKKTKKNEEKEDDGVWEDIYGRLRSKDGAVLENNGTRTEMATEKIASSGKYVPPMLRGNQAKRDKIIKQLKGLLNRLSESNMHSIANQVEEMYMANSRNEMNQTLLELLTAALVRPTIMPERVVLEHIMLIAVLHANVGTEVGAFFIQSFTQEFKSKYDVTELSSEDENKELENLSLIISFIYHFKIVDACLIYDILKLLGESFKSKDIEIILTILRSIGFRLRKDDPTALKDLIIMLQQKASKLQAGETGSAKVKFMLEILLAIRNNNMNKIPNYDPSFGDHLQKILKSHLHPGTYVSEMKIGLKDLLNVDKAGRWWIVGSAWTGKQTDQQEEEKEDSVTTNMSSEDAAKHAKLLKRARAQGMTTDARRNIFCILMTAEDYLDAFEKLNHLDLRNNQDREIIHVSTYCCLQEKRFNPYYALIVSKFATTDRKLMLALQFNLWDRLKDLKNLSSHQRTNLAQLLVHLINDKSLPLSTLKIIEYTEMDKTKLKFLKKVLTGILLQKDVVNMQEIFIKPALSEKLGLFRESLRLFLSHFMLQKSITTTDGSTVESDSSPEEMEALKQRVKMAEKCMTLGKSSLL